MPYRSGALSSKLKYISGPAEITVRAPYAKYQYYGKVMVDPKINAAGFLTKDGHLAGAARERRRSSRTGT